MAHLNHFHLVGVLKKDVGMRPTKKGRDMAILQIKMQANDFESSADVLAFDDTAEACRGLREGSEVDVEGYVSMYKPEKDKFWKISLNARSVKAIPANVEPDAQDDGLDLPF